MRFPAADEEVGVDTDPGGFVGEWWNAWSSPCAVGKVLIEPGVGFVLACTGVLDEDNIGALIGAKPGFGGLIGANELLGGAN